MELSSRGSGIDLKFEIELFCEAIRLTQELPRAGKLASIG